MVVELVVEVLLEGVAVWSKVAVAVTTFPLRPRGSLPLTNSNVPVSV